MLSFLYPAMDSSSTPLYYSSSPAVPLPAMTQPEHGYFSGTHYGTINTTDMPLSQLQSDSMVPTPGSLAGRKRSRGDLDAPEDEELLADGSVSTPASGIRSRGEPVFGPGMTISYPNDPNYVARPESQSGTWVEERAALNQFQLIPPTENGTEAAIRPGITTRKSQRVENTSAEDDNLANLLVPPSIREAAKAPLIDEATRALGISWTRMDSTEALMISSAAYSKWIQNHYASLRDVQVWFENSALPGYLVVATNAFAGGTEYYIFSHDLHEARLVTKDETALLSRLQMLPALELAAPGGVLRAETNHSAAAAMARHMQEMTAPAAETKVFPFGGDFTSRPAVQVPAGDAMEVE